jgi:DNA-binding XRE family transcriptional regulator
MDFAQLTREAVVVMGSVAALSQRLGVTKASIYAWLAGKSIPRGDHAFAMADLIRARRAS